MHLGDDPGQASAYDVALLDVFTTSVSGIAHAFALASAEGIDLERFAAFATGIGGLLPEMITRFARQIQTGRYPGDRSTIASAASGITHIIATPRPQPIMKAITKSGRKLATSSRDRAPIPAEYALVNKHGAG